PRFQVIARVQQRLFSLSFRRTYPTCRKSAGHKSHEIRGIRRVYGERTKRRNKKVIHGQSGKENREQPRGRSAKPCTGHYRSKKQEQKRVRKQVLQRQA